ncbi:hypothetical protein [Ramlibacter sp.]|uniref:hypothetical protein n=1 Tax=Ramlibacter sp. TaxID=1917967 RepID=UPI002D6C95CB|nr:hypothetical protein [Ramlibacter sp.]HYD75602.1 hypothetical protein [Ramlibacter sp.]
MRAVFSLLGLLLVVAVVGVLAKKQLSSGVAPATSVDAPAGVAVPAGTPKQQLQQFEQAVQGAMQQRRPMPDEAQ